MKLPRIQLTAAAKNQLCILMESIENFRPLASIVWSESGEGRYPDGRVVRYPPGWSVGFYDAAKIPSEFVVDVDGIAFALEPDTKVLKLDGCTLDFDGTKFHVRSDAV